MKALMFVFCITCLASCGAGSGVGLDDNGRPINETAQPPIPDEQPDGIKPNLTSIQEHVFTPICSSCHGGVSPAAGQDLSSIENSIENLINVDSSNPEFKRVLPGSPLASYLYLKVTGDSKAGARMPLGQPALPVETINAIKQWIEQGALVPEQANTPTMITKVSQQLTKSVSVDHIIQESDKARLLTMTFWFNKPMNFSGLHSNQIVVSITDKNQEFAKGGSVISSGLIVINSVNDHVLQVKVHNIPAQATGLTIELNNTNISTIISNSGQQLDGDLDGKEGGSFSYEISL